MINFIIYMLAFLPGTQQSVLYKEACEKQYGKIFIKQTKTDFYAFNHKPVELRWSDYSLFCVDVTSKHFVFLCCNN